MAGGAWRLGSWRKSGSSAPALQKGLDPSKNRLGVAAGVQGRLRREIGEAGEGGDEFLRVGVPGCAEDLRGGTTLDDFAGVQNGDAMAERGDGE